MENLTGLATGIGSLPHKDAQAALELVFQYCPQIPFWPQLPKRDIREGMLAQLSERLPGLRLTKDGLEFCGRDKDRELEIFYERLIARDKEYFRISPDYARGLYGFKEALGKKDLASVCAIKCHSVGPFTFAAGIKDESGAALLHDAVLMQAVIKGLSMKALWQIDFFRPFGKKIIIFLDEPYLGCFGSAYTPINREEVVKGLTEMAAAVKAQDTLVGVHCCGNTDWSIFTEIEGIDIINFDAFGYLDRFCLYAGGLQKFLRAGKYICWGVVPTQELAGAVTAEGLKNKVLQGVDTLAKKGVDRDLAFKQLLLSPACGLGTLSPAKAKGILKLLSKTSALFENAFLKGHSAS